MNDSTSARDGMITDMEKRGIRDARILDAMRHIPREKFVDPELAAQAYCDMPLPIGEGQTISQPLMTAMMIEAAGIEPPHRVLEIGAGSGYSAAVLGRLAQRVWTIERLARLARFAGARIAELGLANVTVLRGDGTAGWAPAAPFNAILVTASGPSVPAPLRQQLAIGGRLIIPVGPDGNSQRLLRITRNDRDDFAEEDLGAVAFVPLIGEHGFAEPAGHRQR